MCRRYAAKKEGGSEPNVPLPPHGTMILRPLRGLQPELPYRRVTRTIELSQLGQLSELDKSYVAEHTHSVLSTQSSVRSMRLAYVASALIPAVLSSERSP
jgi:hypothetical protein